MSAQRTPGPLSRAQVVEIARYVALAHGEFSAHGYLPRTPSEGAAFVPHEWVIDAMFEAIAKATGSAS